MSVLYRIIFSIYSTPLVRHGSKRRIYSTESTPCVGSNGTASACENAYSAACPAPERIAMEIGNEIK
jgi:hypothetical protein